MKQFYFAVSIVMAMTTALLLLAAVAGAQERPCAGDFKQYCSDVTPGGGRLVSCYERYKDKMSPACTAWAERAKSNAAALKRACSKEIDAGCNFEKGDPLETLDCLQGNYINLSPGCVEALNQFKWRYPVPAK